MSEDAVNVAGRVIISELPFLELFNIFVRKAQFGFAFIAIFN